MDKEDAVRYLEKHEEIREIEKDLDADEKKFYNAEEKKKIEDVMKRGKIYGDPLVELD